MGGGEVAAPEPVRTDSAASRDRPTRRPAGCTRNTLGVRAAPVVNRGSGRCDDCCGPAPRDFAGAAETANSAATPPLAATVKTTAPAASFAAPAFASIPRSAVSRDGRLSTPTTRLAGRATALSSALARCFLARKMSVSTAE